MDPPAWQMNEGNGLNSHFTEINLDVKKDSVTLRSVLPGNESLDGNFIPEWRSFRSSMPRTSSRIRHLSHELKHELKRLSRNFSSYGGSTRSWTSRSSRFVRTKSSAEHALQGLRFISKTADQQGQWQAVADRFHKLSVNGLLERENFGLCIGMDDSNEFAGALFDALSRRQDFNLDKIDIEQLHNFWLQISDQSFDARMQIFFDMCDKNLDGRITEDEVKEVIMLSASANKLAKLKDQAEEYAALIMEELDPHNLGYIEVWQLETLLQSPSAYERLSHTNSQVLAQTLMLSKKRSTFTRCQSYIYRNWQRLWILALWIGAMIGLFIWKFIQYKNRAAFSVMGYCVCTAKGAAETLKLNMALILLPVCRNIITSLRSIWVNSIVPFDNNIYFHKLVAAAIAIGVAVHTIIHLSCDFPRIVGASPEKFNGIGRYWHYKQPSYSDLVKSTVGITGILMVMLMFVAYAYALLRFSTKHSGLPWPLEKLTGYNAFWYSHHLFALVYVLLLIHSYFIILTSKWHEKTTWMYLAVPLLLYLGERLLRTLRSSYYNVKIVKVAIYGGNVLALHMIKPPGFKYKSGMYIYLNCPIVSPLQWHPFSITSAPGDEYLSVHIRSVGDWTREVEKIFSEVCEPSTNNRSGLLRAEHYTEEEHSSQLRFPKLLIDGPYGAPTQNYKKYDVLLLIGLGIGATPFISVLKDILNDIKMFDQQQDSILIEMGSPSPKRTEMGSPSPKRRKRKGPTNAYFYWVTKEQASLEWFKNVMQEVSELDHKAVVEMHNYLTSVYEVGDARSALITMIQSLHHAKKGVDIVSGTQVKTHFARPKWEKVFAKLANTHRNSTIGVFYCGTRVLVKELRRLSEEYSSITTCRFEFHKENFY